MADFNISKDVFIESLGDVSKLLTDKKSNTVEAINEVKGTKAEKKHSSEHNLGASDELDIKKLKNFKEEISDKFLGLSKKVSGTITPEEYGAKGDGITDDTGAFQKAVNEAVNRGTNVVLTKGSYKVGTLSNSEQIMFIGDGVTFTQNSYPVTSVKSLSDKIGNRTSSLSNLTYQSVSYWLNEQEARLWDVSINVKNKEYGAIGDGASHPVYPTYATKTVLQTKYPGITDSYLTSIGVDPTTTAWQSLEVDWCAITQALLDAKSTSNPAGRKYAVFIPSGNFICRHPFQLYSGLTMTGLSGINGNEFDNRTTIWNGLTDMFVFNGADVTDICITGLTFSSSTVNIGATNFIQQQDGTTGYILRYSNIYNCAFKYFNYTINGRILGVRFYKNNINNGTHALKLFGSDSIIEQNYIAVQPNNDATFFIVELSAFTLNRFTNNFITGRKSIALKCYKVYATIIDKNWFDYTDGSGVFIQESKSTSFTNNFFGRNCTAPFSFYSGAVTIYDSNELLFEGNTFYEQPTGIVHFSIRKSISGCSKITIRGNAYDGKAVSVNIPASEESFMSEIRVKESGSKYESGTGRYNWFPIGDTFFDTAMKREIIYEGSGKWRSHIGSLAWSPNSTFAVNDIVVTNNNVYQCTVAGTTGSTNPVHTSGTGSDGTVTWQYVKSII